MQITIVAPDDVLAGIKAAVPSTGIKDQSSQNQSAHLHLGDGSWIKIDWDTLKKHLDAIFQQLKPFVLARPEAEIRLETSDGRKVALKLKNVSEDLVREKVDMLLSGRDQGA